MVTVELLRKPWAAYWSDGYIPRYSGIKRLLEYHDQHSEIGLNGSCPLRLYRNFVKSKAMELILSELLTDVYFLESGLPSRPSKALGQDFYRELIANQNPRYKQIISIYRAKNRGGAYTRALLKTCMFRSRIPSDYTDPSTFKKGVRSVLAELLRVYNNPALYGKEILGDMGFKAADSWSEGQGSSAQK